MNKNTLIIIIVVLLAGVAYFLLGDKAKLAPDTATTSEKPSAAIGAEVFAALNKLESLKLDDSIFSNPVYKSLVPFGKEIKTNPKGKDNPFRDNSGTYSGATSGLPVPNTTSSLTSTSTATTTRPTN